MYCRLLFSRFAPFFLLVLLAVCGLVAVLGIVLCVELVVGKGVQVVLWQLALRFFVRGAAQRTAWARCSISWGARGSEIGSGKSPSLAAKSTELADPGREVCLHHVAISLIVS